MVKHFIPVALDTYFRGAQDEVEFCKAIGAGGNHVVAATAGGRVLGKSEHLSLRERDLGPALAEFHKLSEEERRPKLPSAEGIPPPQRPVPVPPEKGLILRGYCTYLGRDGEGRIARSREFYYKENPDRWAAETQSDMLWLSESEWKALIPAEGKVEVPEELRKRFFCTIGIDYMEGSVNSLPARETALTLTVEKSEAGVVDLRIGGYAKLGKPYDEARRRERDSRGCEVRVLGFARVTGGVFDRFDLVGVGEAWASKMDYTKREVRIEAHPWMYGIAVELVKTREPIDLIPPYNMIHYDSARAYRDGR